MSYIYFTRIIVFLLGSTLQWEKAYWATVATQLGEQAHRHSTGCAVCPVALTAYRTVALIVRRVVARAFNSVLWMVCAATFVFYAVTGYKFRPMSANPCVQAAQNAPLLRHCGQLSLQTAAVLARPFYLPHRAHSPVPIRCVRCFRISGI